jgi:hypothetical protein
VAPRVQPLHATEHGELPIDDARLLGVLTADNTRRALATILLNGHR